MRRLLGVIFALLLTVFSLGVSFGEDVSYSTSPKDIIIQISVSNDEDPLIVQKTRVPLFTLYGDGRVIYVVEDEKHNLKLMEGHIPAKDISFLLKFIEKQGFFDLNDNYLNLTVEGLDTTTITVNTNDESKSIIIYGMKIASMQGMVPRGLVKIYRKLLSYEPKNVKEYVPERISLFVREYKKNLPSERKLVKWRVKGLKLADLSENKRSLFIKYKETVLDGKKKKDVLKRIKGKTLFENRGGFYKYFFVEDGKVYKVAYKPHLPYE